MESIVEVQTKLCFKPNKWSTLTRAELVDYDQAGKIGTMQVYLDVILYSIYL